MTQTLHALPDAALDQLFRQARTVHAFRPEPVPEATLHALYELLKWGPTAFNAQPARFVFVRSAEAKARLKPALSAGNQAQTEAAPVSVIVAQDSRFQEHLPSQFPAYDAKPLFDANPALAQATAFRNSSLQGAYLILAARALGLDAGPQSGFNPAAVDAAFFPDGRYSSNFIVNLGVGDPAGTHPRGPRLPFDRVAEIV
jgi:3-hydroxypropanoate dehydrogenase